MLHIVPNYNTPPISEGDGTNPVVLVVDGTNGEAVVNRMLLHNDDPTKFYSDVTLYAGNVPRNFTLKILMQDAQPTDEQWAAATNSAQCPDIGDSSKADIDYHPFWVYYTVPKGTSTITITNSFLQAIFTEGAVS